MPGDDIIIAATGVGVTLFLPLFWALYHMNGKLNKLLESHDTFEKFTVKIDARVKVLEDGVGSWFRFAVVPRVKMQCDLSCSPMDKQSQPEEYKDIIRDSEKDEI